MTLPARVIARGVTFTGLLVVGIALRVELAVTLSFGVAAISGGDVSGAERLAEADAALYLAKERGRDRVIAA